MDFDDGTAACGEEKILLKEEEEDVEEEEEEEDVDDTFSDVDSDLTFLVCRALFWASWAVSLSHSSFVSATCLPSNSALV